MISKFSVKRPYTVLVGVILIIVLGIVSLTKMSSDLLPDINLPYVVIMTTYVGASPETVEMAVTSPIEASMATVSNIKEITSSSSENYSLVILEFSDKADMNSVSIEIRENLDQLKAYWDDSVGNPIVMKINPNMLPQMIAAVGVEGMDEAEVSTFAQEKIIPQIESIEGVASVSPTGLFENSIQVVIREDKIAAINEHISELIDEKFEEAYEKIADARKEIEDGEEELSKAQSDMEKGEKQIKKSEKKIKNGKSELEKTKDATISELSNAKLQVLEAKADLEAAKTTISTNLATAEALFRAFRELEEIYGPLEIAWTNLDAAATREFYFTTVENAMDAYQMSLIDAPTLAATKAMLTNPSAPTSMLLSDDVRTRIDHLDFTLPDTKAEYDTLMQEYYATMSATYTTVKSQYTQLKKRLEGMMGGSTGADIDAYFKQQNAAMETITENIEALDAKILELYEGESAALVEFANGLSQLELAQYQIDSSKAQMESGKTQIENTKTQLSDAKAQLDESLEDIEEQKRDAKKQADMTGVLTTDTVSALLTAQNFAMPAGYMQSEGDSLLIRVGDKPSDADELEKLPLLLVPMTEDEIIYLSDVADVIVTSNSGETYTNVNGKRGVVLSIQKQTGYSTGDVADSINERFDELREQYEDLTLISLMDQGIYIDLVMNTIFENVLVGGLLAVIILIFFLRDIRPTLIIAISIPVSLIAAIVCMYFSGVTLNIISLSGLALGVGMLVDNSIVVIENIYRMRNEGAEIKTAAIEGAKEVAGAIFASTLTTVCVFLPIVFTEGLTRQLFVDMGLTIAYSLLASLAVALTVVPALASKMLKKVKVKGAGRNDRGFYKAYRGFLKGCLKVKWLVILVAIALLGASVYGALQTGIAYFPDMESTQITVTLSRAEEAPDADVTGETNKLIEDLMTMEDVLDVGAMASSSTLSLLTGQSSSGGEISGTTIYITTVEDRALSTDEIVASINRMAEKLNGVNISIETATFDMSALGGSGISLQIKGRDLDTLYELATKAQEIMASCEGVGKVSDIADDATGEFRITVDKDKAILKGLTVAQVYTQVYPKFQDKGAATTLSTASEDISVYVSSESDESLTIDELKELPITFTNSEGKAEEIKLCEIATFTNISGINTINRIGQTRYVSVSASLAEGYNVGPVSSLVEKEMGKLDVPKGYTIEFTGENEEIMEALSQLTLMLVLAVVFIYLIMVAQFQSLLSPFIIMFTIPLAFTGGFAALYFTGYEVSIIAMIGFVMLSGIIVNNGIVLVDYIGQRREQGISKKEAILDAGVTRLRPVLMTALTTILALMTMAFSQQLGADMSRPLAIVVIGGMIYGTLMTLIVVPCIYDIFIHEKKDKKEKKTKEPLVKLVVLEDADEENGSLTEPVLPKAEAVKKPSTIKKTLPNTTEKKENPYMAGWRA